MKGALTILIFFIAYSLSHAQTSDMDSSESYAVLIFTGTKAEVKKEMKKIKKQRLQDELMMVSDCKRGYILAGTVPCGKKQSKEKVLGRIIENYPSAVLIKCSELSPEEIPRYWTTCY